MAGFLRSRPATVCIPLLAFLVIGAAKAAQPAPVIALVQEETVPNTDGKLRTGLRLAFVKTADGWTAICDTGKSKNSGCKFNAAAPSQWIVSDRGKRLGEVTAKSWLDNGYNSETGLLAIVSGLPQRQGKRSQIFGGWSGNAVYRPLIATSIAPASGARWREVYPEKMATDAILSALRKQVSVLPDCRSDAKKTAPLGKPRPLAESDVHVFETSQSATGELLVGAAIKPELVKDCDYTADSLADVWLYSDGKSSPRALPALIAAGTMHALIGIGDFASDGNEEALFFLSGYNRDGFVLTYDHFRKVASFTWSYQ